jgi:hypothetical protein
MKRAEHSAMGATYHFWITEARLSITKEVSRVSSHTLSIPISALPTLCSLAGLQITQEPPEGMQPDIALMQARLEALEAAARRICEAWPEGARSDYVPIKLAMIEGLKRALGGEYDPQSTTYQGEPS